MWVVFSLFSLPEFLAPASPAKVVVLKRGIENQKLANRPTEESYSESLGDFGVIVKIFLAWAGRNKWFILISQLACFSLAFWTFSNTEKVVESKAEIFTHWTHTHDLSDFFEGLRDAELKNQLSDFWAKGGYNKDGNDIENLRIYFGEKKPSYAFDSTHFLLQFEQKMWEPDTNTISRLERILYPVIMDNKKLKFILSENKEAGEKLLTAFKALNALPSDISESNQKKEEFLELKNYLFNKGNKKLRSAQLKLSIRITDKFQFVPKKRTIIFLSGAEIFFLLVFLIRFLWFGK
jgi:hypothetical protein